MPVYVSVSEIVQGEVGNALRNAERERYCRFYIQHRRQLMIQLSSNAPA